MRVSKVSSGTTTKYRYDGQMGMQDVEVTGANTVVTNYGLGARGVDFIERVGTSTVSGFPIYDAHGNNMATLTRNGTTYSIGDQRSYDAWGGVRAQQNAGDPKLRYCANLGHKQDDESGLIYMRARYYEPGSGRFVSQDPADEGTNWFVYGENNPVSLGDYGGTDPNLLASLLQLVFRLLQDAGLKILANAALRVTANWLADRLDAAANRLLEIGNQNALEGLTLARAAGDNALAGLAAGYYGKLGARQIATGLTLKSIANWLRYLGDSGDDFGGGDGGITNNFAFPA